jgi:hypothetical protein
MKSHTPESEILMRLCDVPSLAWLPRRRKGARLNFSTVWRWALRGVHGIRLRTVVVGGTRCTSERWLREFFAALAGNPITTPAIRTPARRQREIAQAQEELRAHGIL